MFDSIPSAPTTVTALGAYLSSSSEIAQATMKKSRAASEEETTKQLNSRRLRHRKRFRDLKNRERANRNAEIANDAIALATNYNDFLTGGI